MRTAIVVLILLSALDLTTTYVGLGRGIPEANPLAVASLAFGPVGLALFKVGLVCAMVAISARANRRHHHAWCILMLPVTLTGLIVISNVWLIAILT